MPLVVISDQCMRREGSKQSMIWLTCRVLDSQASGALCSARVSVLAIVSPDIRTARSKKLERKAALEPGLA